MCERFFANALSALTRNLTPAQSMRNLIAEVDWDTADFERVVDLVDALATKLRARHGSLRIYDGQYDLGPRFGDCFETLNGASSATHEENDAATNFIFVGGTILSSCAPETLERKMDRLRADALEGGHGGLFDMDFVLAVVCWCLANSHKELQRCTEAARGPRVHPIPMTTQDRFNQVDLAYSGWLRVARHMCAGLPVLFMAVLQAPFVGLFMQYEADHMDPNRNLTLHRSLRSRSLLEVADFFLDAMDMVDVFFNFFAGCSRSYLLIVTFAGQETAFARVRTLLTAHPALLKYIQKLNLAKWFQEVAVVHYENHFPVDPGALSGVCDLAVDLNSFWPYWRLGKVLQVLPEQVQAKCRRAWLVWYANPPQCIRAFNMHGTDLLDSCTQWSEQDLEAVLAQQDLSPEVFSSVLQRRFVTHNYEVLWNHVLASAVCGVHTRHPRAEDQDAQVDYFDAALARNSVGLLLDACCRHPIRFCLTSVGVSMLQKDPWTLVATDPSTARSLAVTQAKVCEAVFHLMGLLTPSRPDACWHNWIRRQADGPAVVVLRLLNLTLWPADFTSERKSAWVCALRHVLLELLVVDEGSDGKQGLPLTVTKVVHLFLHVARGHAQAGICPWAAQLAQEAVLNIVSKASSFKVHNELEFLFALEEVMAHYNIHKPEADNLLQPWTSLRRSWVSTASRVAAAL